MRRRGVAATYLRGISTPRPRRRRDSAPRNIHAAASPRFVNARIRATGRRPGDYRGAADDWGGVVQADVTDALTDQALFQAARALDALGDGAAAITCYERFAARQPKDALVHFNMGEIHGRRDMYPRPRRRVFRTTCLRGMSRRLGRPVYPRLLAAARVESRARTSQ